MDSPNFQQLLELEHNLSQAQEALSESGNTDLLFQHLEAISSNNSSSSSSGSSSNAPPTNANTCSKEDIIELLKHKSSSNLALTCSRCHQTLFLNDEMANDNISKEDLQSCCLKTLNQSYSDVEISFWWFLINSYTSCILTLPNYTRFMLTSGGIPPSLRDRVWGILTQSCDSTGLVDEYMQTLYNSLNTDISPDLRIILKDVNRTFPELSMFNEYDTKVKFEKILNAYSIFDSDMGYCQGLQFIVAPFLFHFIENNEHTELKTFNSIVNFFDINKLRNIYDNQMTDLHLWFYQFEEIFKNELPELYQHFFELEIDLKIFLSQWFLSFYSITIPFSFLIRMFDLMLFEGVKPTLLRVGIVILKKNLNLLSNIDDVELIYQHLLSENCWGVFSNDVDEFINSILNIPIDSFTQEFLYSLEQDYSSLSESSLISNEESFKNENVFNKVFSKLSLNLKSSAESIFSSNSSQNESTRSNSIFSSSNSSSSTTETKDVESTLESPIESPIESPSDLELLQDLYKLCLSKNIKSPILDQVRERLSIEN